MPVSSATCAAAARTSSRVPYPTLYPDLLQQSAEQSWCCPSKQSEAACPPADAGDTNPPSRLPDQRATSVAAAAVTKTSRRTPGGHLPGHAQSLQPGTAMLCQRAPTRPLAHAGRRARHGPHMQHNSVRAARPHRGRLKVKLVLVHVCHAQAREPQNPLYKVHCTARPAPLVSDTEAVAPAKHQTASSAALAAHGEAELWRQGAPIAIAINSGEGSSPMTRMFAFQPTAPPPPVAAAPRPTLTAK